MNKKVSLSSDAQTEHVNRDEMKLRSVAELPEHLAPAGVPSDYIVTPFGYFPPESVHEIGDNKEISQGPSSVPAERDENSSLIIKASDNLAGKEVDHTKPYDSATVYVNFYTFYDSQKISLFTGNCMVPHAPEAVTPDRPLCFNMGLEEKTGVAGIKSVLGWNLTRNECWSLSNWYTVGGALYHTPLLKVSTGQKIEVSIKWLSSDDEGIKKSYRWMVNSTATSSTRGEQCSLTINTREKLNLLISPRITAVNTWTFKDFPPEGKIDFINVTALDENGDLLDLYSHWGFKNTSSYPFSFHKKGKPTSSSDITLSWSDSDLKPS